MDGIRAAPTPDELFRIVRHPIRRWLLKTLPVASPIAIDTLAQDGVESHAIAPRLTHRQLVLSLQHVHLPRLEEAGFVAVDYDAGEVVLDGEAKTILTPAVVELDALLTEIEDDPSETTLEA